MNTDRYFFHGKTVNGDWCTGYLSIITKGQKAKVEPGYYISNASGMPFAFQVRPETVGQCTGQKDKKGVLIFEGDLLDFNGMLLIVSFSNGSFVYVYKNRGRYRLREDIARDSVIIGNVHDDHFRDPTKMDDKKVRQCEEWLKQEIEE